MDIKELAERAVAVRDEYNLLKKELRDYANEHPSEADAADTAYRRKANCFSGDISPARVARVAHKMAYPT